MSRLASTSSLPATECSCLPRRTSNHAPDELADGQSAPRPSVEHAGTGISCRSRQPTARSRRHPAQDLRVREVKRAVAHLPDAGDRARARCRRHGRRFRPAPPPVSRDRDADAARCTAKRSRAGRRRHRAAPGRRRRCRCAPVETAMAVEANSRCGSDATIEPIEPHVQRRRRQRRRLQEPPEQRPRFLGAPELQERVDRRKFESRIQQPAVVPVAHAADGFGQRRSSARRHRRAGWREINNFSTSALRSAASAHGPSHAAIGARPSFPESDRVFEPRGDVPPARKDQRLRERTRQRDHGTPAGRDFKSRFNRVVAPRR